MNGLEYLDIFIIALMPVSAVLLWFMADYSEKVRNSKFRACWLAPAFLTAISTYIVGFEKLMIPAYVGAVTFVFGMLRPEKKARRLSSAAAAVIGLTALPLCMFCKCYRTVDLVKNFNDGFELMKEHYVLADEKEIDWDALYDKYLPQFEEADREHDVVLNEIVWAKYCAEFHDLHVNYASDEETHDAAGKRAGGNDYGLVIMKLADGSFAAVQVDDKLKAMGIHNGTPVISWNGMSPDEADSLSELAAMQNYADEDNAEFFEGFCAAGTGGDTAELKYTDDDGSEQTVILSKLSDDYYSRWKDACDAVCDGMKVGHMTVNKVNDTTACLRIKTMQFDSISEDDDHAAMQQELRDKINEMKQQGIRDVVIDIRENNGGSGSMVKAIAQLFAPEGEHYYVTDAYWDDVTHTYTYEGDGKWKTGDDITFNGENILGDDGRIVVLVSAHSVSAADHITKLMSSFDNTTVIGFTESSGSAQGVSPSTLDHGMLSFSSSLMLNKDGSIFIDSGTDVQSDIDVDIKVPFDEKALTEIFDNGSDHLMNVSLEYLADLDR